MIPPASYIQRALFRLPFLEEGGCISRNKMRECSREKKRDRSFSKEPMEQVYEWIPRYPETSKTNLIKIEEGMVVDADPILSMFPMEMRRRVRDSKYLIVSCFMAPVLFDDCQSRSIGSFVSVSSELRTLYGSDIEMILVAKMRQKWSKDKASFDHFFSGFPSFSNIIPFSDTTARDHICLQLGFTSYFPIYLLLKRFSASTNCFYRVLRHSSLNDFNSYGADLFPFTQDILKNWRIFRDESVHRKFPPDLDKLLGCKSSELQVCKFSTPTGGGGAGAEWMALSGLRGKVMGLYLCSNGSMIPDIDMVCRQCRERGFEFEVVLMYVPCSHFGLYMKNFIDLINEELHHWDTRSWWILPFVDSISRRLHQLCPNEEEYHPDHDRVIVFGPHDEYVDPYAGPILRLYGIDTYPFTRKRVIDWELEKVRSLTLESLWVYRDRDYVLGNCDIIRVPVAQLRGRIVLVQFGTNNISFEFLNNYYAHIKGAYPRIKRQQSLTLLHLICHVGVPF